jgi:hypothetical protein
MGKAALARDRMTKVDELRRSCGHIDVTHCWLLLLLLQVLGHQPASVQGQRHFC